MTITTLTIAIAATCVAHVLIHTIWDWVDARREHQQ